MPLGELPRSGSYIPHIDGLRAVAVLAVMVYHADRSWLPGGYAGVDAFFVISGYLITRVIMADRAAGRFSLWRFWDRRIRRIMPPLLAVLAFSLAAGYLFMTPAELAGLGASAFASLASAGNLYFWLSAGSYFGLAAPLQPLLHLWSLGVEEQFYLVYPLVLLLAWRLKPSALLAAMLVGVGVSFALAVYTAQHHPAAGFFLPFSRVWELATGCALALWLQGKAFPPAWLAELATAAALAALAATFVLIDDLTLWPGWATAPAVIASSALIACAPAASVLGRLLAARPMVAIGLVSYAAYLWHHPLLAFVRVVDPNQLSAIGAIGLLAASLGMGALSYRFIERRARDRTRSPARLFWPALLGSAVVVAAASLHAWLTAGAPGRLPANLAAVSDMTQSYPKAMDPCFYLPNTTKTFEQSCLRGASGPVRMAIIGDSHAAALAQGFDPVLAQTGTRMRLLVAAGCPPVSDPRVMSELQPHCPAFAEKVLAWLEAQPDIPVVAMAARWPYSFHHDFYDNGEGGVEIGPDDGLERDPARDRLFAQAVKATVDRLLAAGKTVVLVYPVPEPGWDVPKFLVHRYLQGKPAAMPSIDEARWRERAADAVSMLDALGTDPRIVRVRPASQTCGRPSPGRCALGIGATPWYFDDDHPSAEGTLVMIDGALRATGAIQPLAKALRQGRTDPGGQ
ncbi:acyltransferase family protein [Tsuneonella sp. HG222]